MHEIPRQVLISLPTILGVDLSITNSVLLVWVSAAVTFVLLVCACRRKREELVPRGAFANFFEALIEFVDRIVVRDSVGEHARFWSPLLLTFFFFILIANLLGLLPFPSHVQAVTSDINVTAALALVVFVLTIVISVRRRGMLGFLKQFLPRGVSPWIAALIMPIEVISWLARPISLAVRLFANILAGHTLILVFVSLTAAAAWFLKPLPLAGAVVMSVFELFVSFIQAFVFTMLAGIYIKEALETH